MKTEEEIKAEIAVLEKEIQDLVASHNEAATKFDNLRNQNIAKLNHLKGKLAALQELVA